jgi:hypothetical protein
VIKNMIKIPSDAISKKNIKILDKSISNNIFHQKGTAKIETKSGDLKIDTKDAESLELVTPPNVMQPQPQPA